LWTEDIVEHHGRFFDFGPVMFEPKPVQRPGPRLHIGGDGPAALRRAATVGDGWIPMNHTVEEIPEKVARLAELRDEAGRPGRTEITLSVSMDRPDDIERCAEVGIDRVFVKPWRRTSDAIESIGRFADEFLAT
jgi:alkanesulfonate monooxygenase SsuD/methylene tetrahydromethanopterin reductase-like flavin-dependent oxidoreductase (luciferase family)